MNSKEKGNIGEAMIINEFVKRGIQVSIPFGDNSRYDLIADQKIVNNSVLCPCASSLYHTTNKVKTDYSNDVDYMAFYIVAFDACCLVPIDIIGNRKSINFRRSYTNRASPENAHLIETYSFDKIIHT